MKARDQIDFNVLAGLQHGVQRIALCHTKVVDHCVIIDANRNLIFGSAGKNPVRLSVEALKICEDDKANKFDVAEGRELL